MNTLEIVAYTQYHKEPATNVVKHGQWSRCTHFLLSRCIFFSRFVILQTVRFRTMLCIYFNNNNNNNDEKSLSFLPKSKLKSFNRIHEYKEFWMLIFIYLVHLHTILDHWISKAIFHFYFHFNSIQFKYGTIELKTPKIVSAHINFIQHVSLLFSIIIIVLWPHG